VEPVDENYAEAPAHGIVQQAPAFRPLVEVRGAADAVVDVLARRGKLMQLAIPAQEVELALDGLALGLVIGGDPGVQGDGERPVECHDGDLVMLEVELKVRACGAGARPFAYTRPSSTCGAAWPRTTCHRSHR